MPSKLACTGEMILGTSRSGEPLIRSSLVVVVLGVGERGLPAGVCGETLAFFCCVAIGEKVSSPPMESNVVQILTSDHIGSLDRNSHVR
jgi:hypothetical protein